MEVNSGDLVALGIGDRSVSVVVESVKFIVFSGNLSYDSLSWLLLCGLFGFLGLELLELHGLLLESSDGVLTKARIVITVSEFAGFFLKRGWSDLKEIVVEVVSVMMMVLLCLSVVHVFTFHLDPFVDSVKRLTVKVSSGSIVVVVDTLEWVESSLSVSNIGIALGFSSNSDGSVLSDLFVVNGFYGGNSSLTSFLFSLLNSIIFILSRSMLDHVQSI